MTDPAAGKFTTQDDVTNRFEGTFPSARLAWVGWRILDAEGELMFWVPSLRKTVDEINAESAAADDPDRLARVTKLVADKVLDLFRNPDGANQQQQAMASMSSSRSYAPDATRGKVMFSASELDSVRLHTRRPRFGTVRVAPPWPTCC